MIHPVLLDPRVAARVAFTRTTAPVTSDAGCETAMNAFAAADTAPFHRARPGYAVFAVPPRFSCLNGNENVSLDLLVKDGGAETAVYSTAFTVVALPAASADPGSKVREAMEKLKAAIAAVTDIFGIIARFIPKLGDQIDVKAQPGSLCVGQSSSLSATIAVKLVSGLCNQGAEAAVGALMDMAKDKLSQRMAAQMPLVGQAFKSANYDRDNMGAVTGLIYGAVGAIAGAILDATGLKDYLMSLAAKVCDSLADPNLPLDPSIIGASCGSVSNASWQCTIPCLGTQTMTAQKTICGNNKTGSSAVLCQNCADGGIDAGGDAGVDAGVDAGAPSDAGTCVTCTPTVQNWGTGYVPQVSVALNPLVQPPTCTLHSGFNASETVTVDKWDAGAFEGSFSSNWRVLSASGGTVVDAGGYVAWRGISGGTSNLVVRHTASQITASFPITFSDNNVSVPQACFSP